MSGYFGTESQQHLQVRAENYVDLINTTAGACQNGRMIGCDDVERFGWERIDTILAQDGVIGFRLLSLDEADRITPLLAARGFRLDRWDIFQADRQSALSAACEIISRGLPDGLAELDSPAQPDDDYTVQIQSLMAQAGVVPFSGSLLIGALGPATTVAVGDRNGAVVAAAHGYMPHNSFSPYHAHAWGGLVAVAESQRGKGLGNYINARMIVSVFESLGASHIYELVSATNQPSRKMVSSCGLVHRQDLVCGMATLVDSARFTR